MTITSSGILSAISCALFFCACTTPSEKKETPVSLSPIHLVALPSAQTGITFNNTLVENDSVNLIANEYTYMGSGVGMGDFNNDNFPDVFLGANQASSRLYINKGKQQANALQFEDITAKAGIKGSFWATGISVVDINNDGYDDIYVCVSGTKSPRLRQNRLYINQKDLTFSEQAAEYGLADTSFSTQAVFLDYDRDGDLDMYLLNHLLYRPNANTIVPRDFSGSSPAADRLYRNEGIPKDGKHPVFKDVSLAAGIQEAGYGLGVVVSDFNNDNWPDIYVTNDYIGNDVLWLNNRKGGFDNRIATSTRHQSYSSMGVDAADINNDALPDIASLDMMPEGNERRKKMFSFMRYDRFEMERRMGYEPSFMRNMLQLNNGNRNRHDTIEPFFSEIGQLAGIQETDWSWSVLMADFDNDGWKDMHITNGMGKDMLNNDYLNYRNEFALSGQFASIEERNRKVAQKLTEYGNVELNNYCFRNTGGDQPGSLTFRNVSAEAGINLPSISSGCAYADLDNDGDLDLVVNNINKEAFVFRNDARTNVKDSTHHYVLLQLKGNELNKDGFGAKVKVYAGNQVQLVEQNPVRGYSSTVDKRLHIGLGKASLVDSITVVWPNNKQQTVRKLPVDQVVKLQQKEAVQDWVASASNLKALFADVTTEKNLAFKHAETFFDDYSFQGLLPQKYSQLGPFITEGDVNADGLTDFFMGGAYNQSGQVFIQQSNGKFVSKELTVGEKNEEDLGCLLFDADGDKDLDLFVNSGGYEYDAGSPYYLPRLYKNDGKGRFNLDKAAIPSTISTSAQAVASADYDGDGDIDLFIGGRISPSQYPIAPRSYLLQNNNGQFSDVTATVCAPLQAPGMITAAVWMDFNNDKKPDLVITGEWMPVRFFQNTAGKLEEVTSSTGLEHMNGQWRSLNAADLDKDGDLDLVAGNLGLNNKYHASPAEPIKLFAKDLDGSGTIDPVVAYYIMDQTGQRQLYPAIGRDQFAMQVPSIKKRYLLHDAYAKARMSDIFTPTDYEGSLELTCEITTTCWLENKGNGKFARHDLPTAAQLAPVNAIVCTDADGDGNIDLLLAGNEYQTEIMTGRYDASYGLLLKGDGKGHFNPVSPASSGLIIDGDVKDLKLIFTGKKEKILLAAINDNKLKALKIK
jgi:hypothetical protein